MAKVYISTWQKNAPGKPVLDKISPVASTSANMPKEQSHILPWVLQDSACSLQENLRCHDENIPSVRHDEEIENHQSFHKMYNHKSQSTFSSTTNEINKEEFEMYPFLDKKQKLSSSLPNLQNQDQIKSWRKRTVSLHLDQSELTQKVIDSKLLPHPNVNCQLVSKIKQDIEGLSDISVQANKDELTYELETERPVKIFKKKRRKGSKSVDLHKPISFNTRQTNQRRLSCRFSRKSSDETNENHAGTSHGTSHGTRTTCCQGFKMRSHTSSLSSADIVVEPTEGHHGHYLDFYDPSQAAISSISGEKRSKSQPSFAGSSDHKNPDEILSDLSITLNSEESHLQAVMDLDIPDLEESDWDSDILEQQAAAPFPFPYMGDLVLDQSCQICYEERPLYLRYCCKAPFCDACLKSYCTYQVTEGSIKFPCPNLDCSQPVYQDEVFARLDRTHKDKLYRFLINANTDPTKRTCPRCSQVTTLASDVLQTIGKKGWKITCDHCELDWCFPCQGLWHEGMSCKRNQRGDKMLKGWAKEVSMGQVNARKCPKCKVYIQRSTGCDHMTCSKCGVSFCYLCGEKFRSFKFLGDHYSRLGIFGCRYNLFPERPALRRFIRGLLFGGILLIVPVAGALALAAGAAVVAGAVVASPILLGLLIRKHRRKQHRLREIREFAEHERQRRERIRNMGCPYMENYQHLQQIGVQNVWDIIKDNSSDTSGEVTTW